VAAAEKKRLEDEFAEEKHKAVEATAQFNTMATGRSNLHVDDPFLRRRSFSMCYLLYLKYFHNREEELKNALATSRSKVQNLEISLREVKAGDQELKRVMKEAADSE
jgi:hypothetical protein